MIAQNYNPTTPLEMKKIPLTPAIAEAIHHIGHEFCEHFDICLFDVEPDGNFLDNGELHIESFHHGATFSFRVTRNEPETGKRLPLTRPQIGDFSEWILHRTLDGTIPTATPFHEIWQCTENEFVFSFWIEEDDSLEEWFESRV
jgi:hypothetical protein